MRDRFYCPGFEIGRAGELEGDEARHLSRVRRVGVGAEVEIFDGRGSAATAEVVRVGRDRVELLPKHRVVGTLPASTAITLATAIPKGDRFDWLVEKATELGVDRLVPLVTERSSVDPRSAKLDRLRRAIIEACKQSRRDMLMVLEDPMTWGDWLRRVEPSNAIRWFAHPGGSQRWSTSPLARGSRIAVAIGPEGGFTDQERELGRYHGWESIHLTSTILRIETAAIGVASLLLLRDCGDGG